MGYKKASEDRKLDIVSFAVDSDLKAKIEKSWKGWESRSAWIRDVLEKAVK